MFPEVTLEIPVCFPKTMKKQQNPSGEQYLQNQNQAWWKNYPKTLLLFHSHSFFLLFLYSEEAQQIVASLHIGGRL